MAYLETARRARAPADGRSTRSASLGLRIHADLKAELARRAAAEGVTVNYYVESLLIEHVTKTRKS